MHSSQIREGKPQITRLRLSLIRADAGTQSRAAISEATVAEYAESMLAGSRFPPVVVFHSKGTYLLADGFHRVLASKLAKLKQIDAEVRQGSRLDAVKFSLSANHTHGLRRSNDDKRHSIEIALRELPQWSDRAIAELCGVSHPSVGVARRELVNSSSCEKRLGRDGKLRQLPVKPSNGEPGLPTDETIQDRFWLTPPELYETLNDRYGPFDFDPCPHPRPAGFDSLKVSWGRCNFVNPPYHRYDGVDGQGPTAFVRKAIAEQQLGKTSVMVLPVESYVNLLLEAGAKLHPLGRVRWREANRGDPMPGPPPICCFVLRGVKKKRAKKSGD
jgi:hypothetical protein